MDGQNLDKETLRSYIKKMLARKLPDVALFIHHEIADHIVDEVIFINYEDTTNDP